MHIYIYTYTSTFIYIYTDLHFPLPFENQTTKPFLFDLTPDFFGQKNIQTTQLPFPGGNIRATELYLRNASTTSNAWMDWSSCRFRFHGWFLFGFGSKPPGGGSRCFTQTPPKHKRPNSVFAKSCYGDGWLEPTTKRCAFFQKGWEFQQDTIHPVKNFAALLQRLSKPAQSI